MYEIQEIAATHVLLVENDNYIILNSVKYLTPLSRLLK